MRGNLGVAAIVFMVVAAAAPLGVIGGVVPLGIASGNGAGFPATFIISTVILLFFAVGFTAMTPYVDEAGAFFSYVRKSLGFPAGIGIAFVAIVSYLAIEAGVYGLLGPAGASVVELFGGPTLPWWLFAAVAFAVTTFLGYRNIELSSRVLAVLLTAEIAIVAVLDLVIVVQGGDHGLSNGIVNPNAILSGSLGIGLLFAIISYVGFEATAIFRDEARTPERTIPRATYVALILIGVFYAVTSWALISGWGDDEAVSRATESGGTFLADTAQRYIGAVGRRHHHGAVLHQPVRLHPVVPQRGVALCVRAVPARRPAGIVESSARQARFAAPGVAVDLGRRRGQRHPGRRVQARPGRAVLHLVRRRHHRRHRGAAARHQRGGAGLLRPRPARPLALAGSHRAGARRGRVCWAR